MSRCTMGWAVVLAVSLMAAQARAADGAEVETPPEPKAVSLEAPSPTRPSLGDWALHLAPVVATVAVMAPTSLFIGQALVGSSNKLGLEVVAGLLPVLLIPPLAAALVTGLFAKSFEPKRFLRSLGIALAVQLVAVLTAALSGASTARGLDVALFTTAEAIALPAASVLAWRL